jgi:hypothetical protein
MEIWFRQKTRVEKLKERYALLMKQSYELAFCDIQKSEKLHSQADELFQEIQNFNMQQIDK